MASLTGNSINTSYQGLLKTDGNGSIPTVATPITDGTGIKSGLEIGNNSGTYQTIIKSDDLYTNGFSVDGTGTNFGGTVDFSSAAITGIDGLAPNGGTTGQILEKQSATDYDYAWVTSTSNPGLVAGTGTSASIKSADFLGVTANIASGTNSIAIGDAITASGNTSVAMGKSATASGTGSTAIGVSVSASNSNAICIGAYSGASANNSIAMGNSAGASGGAAVAIGRLANGNGANGTAVGNEAKANNTDNIAIGYASGYLGTPGQRSVSIGVLNAYAAGQYSVSIGYNATAKGLDSIVMGQNSRIDNSTGTECIAIGKNTGLASTDTATQAVAIGSGAKIGNGANGAVALGSGVTADVADYVTIKQLQILNYSTLNYADDTAAAAGGVPLGGVYHTSGALKVRIS